MYRRVVNVFDMFYQPSTRVTLHGAELDTALSPALCGFVCSVRNTAMDSRTTAMYSVYSPEDPFNPPELLKIMEPSAESI